ncbi:MAG: hypothetical protein JJT77_00355 [Crocinitomicaceae bacterium]|nr:hypothetical protein [Crocinitomicaceae bacterium]
MTKKIIIRSFLFLTFVIILLAAIFYYLLFLDSENTKSVYYPMPSKEQGLLQNGDIIMRQGYGFFSRTIVKLQKCDYPVTHCGMIQLDSLNRPWVIHSLSSSVSEKDGIQIEPLQKFLNESVPRTLIVSRYKGASNIGNQLIERANYYLAKKVPFDHAFDKEDSNEMYCTELFYHIFTDVVRKDIFEKQFQENTTGIYDLTTFLDPEYFEIIVNHSK